MPPLMRRSRDSGWHHRDRPRHEAARRPSTSGWGAASGPTRGPATSRPGSRPRGAAPPRCGRPRPLAGRWPQAQQRGQLPWPPNWPSRPACRRAARRRASGRRRARAAPRPRRALAGLRREVERRHALAVIRPAERAALVRVGAELDELADRGDAPVRGRPRERRAAVGIGVDARAELDEQLDRLDPVGLRRPHERLVEHLLRVVGRLPGRESRRAAGRSRDARRPRACRRARGSGRAARAPPRRAGCRGSSPSRSTTSRCPQKSAATSGVPPSPRAERSMRAARVEHQLRERAVVRVAGLVQLRPAVVVAAVRVGAALEQQPHELEVAGHPEQVVAVRAALRGRGRDARRAARSSRARSPRLDGAVGEHERRRRLVAARAAPRRARRARPSWRTRAGARARAAPRRRVTPLVGRDPVRAALVVVEVGAERLLDVHSRLRRARRVRRPDRVRASSGRAGRAPAGLRRPLRELPRGAAVLDRSSSTPRRAARRSAGSSLRSRRSRICP